VNQSIRDGENEPLVSAGGITELGFFSLGVKYKMQRRNYIRKEEGFYFFLQEYNYSMTICSIYKRN